ncbi:MAG: hypothetical protein Q9224_006799, partial [Gallowayella concinna]
MLSFSYGLHLTFSTLLAISTALTINPHYDALSSRQSFAQDANYVDGSTIRFRGWDITGCVNDPVQGAKRYRLMNFLALLKPHVEAVIADAQKGTGSAHGYSAFFKTATSVRKVVAKYQPLLDASPIILGDARSKELGIKIAPPRFLCVNESNPEHADVMALCNHSFFDLSPQYPVIAHP